MNIAELIAVIDSLPVAQPQTDAFEAEGRTGSSVLTTTGHRNQKEHLQGWLADYDGPGAYGRQHGSDDPKTFYNRFQCAPGLIWLAEALGEDPDVIRRGVDAVRDAGPRHASQAGAFRAVVPWARIEELAEQRLARVRRRARRFSDYAPRVVVKRTPRVAGSPRPRS